jgi:hypothetical protein
MQRLRLIGKRSAIAQRSGFALNKQNVKLSLKTDLISIKQALLTGNRQLISNDDHPGRNRRLLIRCCPPLTPQRTGICATLTKSELEAHSVCLT